MWLPEKELPAAILLEGKLRRLRRCCALESICTSCGNSKPLRTGMACLCGESEVLHRAMLLGLHACVPAQVTAPDLSRGVSVSPGVLLPAFHLPSDISFQSGSGEAGNISYVPKPADELLRDWQEAVRERAQPSGRTSCLFFHRTLTYGQSRFN